MSGIRGMTCPTWTSLENSKITLAHGSGLRMSRELIQRFIQPRFQGERAAHFADAAVLGELPGPLAMTTDSFVVAPLLFPGGDIGKLAVYGTLNDLAVAGAIPKFISVALILEEGLNLSLLAQILESMGGALREAGVEAVCGDTKVVPRGACDGMFINTTGIGWVVDPVPPGPSQLAPGDVLIATGPVGQHGFAILNAREQLEIQGNILSDCGSLLPAVESLRQAGVPVKAMRDATRGGVGGVLHEWAIECKQTLRVFESKLPISDEVRGMSEILGLDPLFVANEGAMVVAVTAADAEKAIAALHTTPIARRAQIIGEVIDRTICGVVIRRSLGRDVPLDEPSGTLLPRIC